MHTNYCSQGLYLLVLSQALTVFLSAAVDAISKGEVEGSVGRQEFEQFRDEVNQKLQKILVGIVKDESLKGPVGTKGEKGETGLPGADANAGLVMTIFERMDRMVQHISPETPCGGYIKVDGSRDLVYKVPATGVRQGCAWIVAAKMSGLLKLRLVEDAELTLNTDFRLGVYNPYYNSDCSYQEITITTWEITMNSQFAIVFFYGHTTRSGEGFKLKIEDSGSSVSSRKLSFLHKYDSFTLHYPPPPLSEYGNSETFFVIGAASPGKMIHVNVTNVTTESGCDYVNLVWADPTMLNLTQCERRSGSGVPNINGAVPENMPFVIYFNSDGSVLGRGFQAYVTYS